MNIINRALRRAAALAFLLTFVAGFSASAFAYTNIVNYSGQGLTKDNFGGYDLNLEICGVANGADVDGPYLLWVLTATGATAADITLPAVPPASGSVTAAMTKTGNGTFKYISAWYEPNALIAFGVYATYNGTKKTAQLTISHGCRPFTTQGAWCSPGFWRNALKVTTVPNAWTLIDVPPDFPTPGSYFNDTVVPDFYTNPFAPAPGPTLQTVLNNPSVGAAGPPLGLTAFNATGAYLTDNIPGYQFDITLLLSGADESDTCPIDHFGNYKNPQ